MHDIVHDFALHLVGHEFLSIVKANDNNTSSNLIPTKWQYPKSTNARHLFIGGTINSIDICDASKVRTCIIARGLPQSVTIDLVKQLKVVRALHLKSCNVHRLPQDIGKLMHLTTLNLSDNPFRELPETIGDLYNLQYLWLEELSNLPPFPKPIGRLINLQHLRGPDFETGSCNLGLLKNLNLLQGVLRINFTNDCTDEVDAKEAEFKRKLHITELAFYFNDHEITGYAFEALEAPPNLQCLEISKFQGPRFPSWIISLRHLSKLLVRGAVQVLSLPPLGNLQSLKELDLSGLSVLKSISREFLGMDNSTSRTFSVFPKLVELIVSDCKELIEWEDVKPEDDDAIVMPKLETLKFLSCPKFEKLPLQLLSRASSLKRLEVSCEKLHILEAMNFHNVEFPTIITSLHYITILDLCNLRVKSLPPLGTLVSLEKLYITYFRILKIISREFLGIDDGGDHKELAVFPKLTALHIVNCNELKQWEDLNSEDEKRG